MKSRQYIQSVMMIMVLFSFTAFVQPALASGVPATIPTILMDMDIHAKTIVDTLLAKDAMTSRKQYRQLKDQITRLHQLIATNPDDDRRARELIMTYSWMRVIDIEITAKSWVEAAVAANQLNGMIIQALHFPTLMQRDIAWLDYLGLEVELLTLENSKANSDLLSVRLITLEDTWSRVREELIRDFKNKPLLLQGDLLVTKIKGALAPTERVALAKKLLDFIVLVKQAK